MADLGPFAPLTPYPVDPDGWSFSCPGADNDPIHRKSAYFRQDNEGGRAWFLCGVSQYISGFPLALWELDLSSPGGDAKGIFLIEFTGLGLGIPGSQTTQSAQGFEIWNMERIPIDGTAASEDPVVFISWSNPFDRMTVYRVHLSADGITVLQQSANLAGPTNVRDISAVIAEDGATKPWTESHLQHSLAVLKDVGSGQYSAIIAQTERQDPSPLAGFWYSRIKVSKWSPTPGFNGVWSAATLDPFQVAFEGATDNFLYGVIRSEDDRAQIAAAFDVRGGSRVIVDLHVDETGAVEDSSDRHEGIPPTDYSKGYFAWGFSQAAAGLGGASPDIAMIAKPVGALDVFVARGQAHQGSISPGDWQQGSIPDSPISTVKGIGLVKVGDNRAAPDREFAYLFGYPSGEAEPKLYRSEHNGGGSYGDWELVLDFADFVGSIEELVDVNPVSAEFYGADDHVLIIVRTNAAFAVPSQQDFRPGSASPYNAWVIFDPIEPVGGAGAYTGPINGAFAGF